MKKLAIVGLLLFCAGKSYAGFDKFGNERPSTWCSSHTAASANFVPIATGTVHFHKVIIGSPTVNAESGYSVYNSTTGAIGGYNPNISTVTFLTTNASVDRIGAYPEVIDYDIPLSSGLILNKIGVADITILWAFYPLKIDPFFPCNP